ncbi:MAG: hypothetical protein KKD18_05385, partial [Nanoarchaeota archaeon]|nr:hypothetical protein [Nanoarchaeota archaeon]
RLADLAAGTGCSTAMIGGALFLMGPLIKALEKKGIEAIYAFSKRILLEEKDGKKISIFQHEGFVKPTGGEWKRAEKICPVDEKKCDWHYGKLFPQCKPSCEKFPAERCALLEKNEDGNAAFEKKQARMLQKNYNGGGKPIPEESEMRLRGTMTSE